MLSAERRTFDDLFAEGRRGLLNGTHKRQSPPSEGASRWGVGAVLRPDPAAADAVEKVAKAAAAFVGDSHWLAGATASSHLTLRGRMEPYRSAVPAGDPLVDRYVAALRTAATRCGPLRFTVTGLTLTPVSVMACAAPADTAANDLASAFSAALGGLGCGNSGAEPSIWYLNLVYYTGPVRSPRALIDWVQERRQTWITDIVVTSIQLVHWQHTAAGMRPTPLASVALAIR